MVLGGEGTCSLFSSLVPLFFLGVLLGWILPLSFLRWRTHQGKWERHTQWPFTYLDPSFCGGNGMRWMRVELKTLGYIEKIGKSEVLRKESGGTSRRASCSFTRVFCSNQVHHRDTLFHYVFHLLEGCLGKGFQRREWQLTMLNCWGWWGVCEHSEQGHVVIFWPLKEFCIIRESIVCLFHRLVLLPFFFFIRYIMRRLATLSLHCHSQKEMRLIFSVLQLCVSCFCCHVPGTLACCCLVHRTLLQCPQLCS